MEKRAKITRTVFVSEWSSPSGQIYYHEIELDNGDKGQIGSKEKMPDKLNPGNVLVYTIEATTRGNKIKAVSQGTPAFAGKKVFQDPRAQFIGFVHAYAKDLVVAGKVELKDINGAAESMFKNMIKLYETIK